MSQVPGIGDVFDMRSPLFSRDFVVVDLLPGITLVSSIAVILMAGAPGSAPNGADFSNALSRVTGTTLTLGLLTGVTVGVALHPFAMRIRRVLSGQWTSRASTPIAYIGLKLSRHRFNVANSRMTAEVTSSPTIRARWSEVFRRELPTWPYLTPTRLGNAYQALREQISKTASKDRRLTSGDDPFGLTDDEVYRIAIGEAQNLKLPIATLVDDARLKTAAAERYVTVWALVTVIYGWVLHNHGLWLGLCGLTIMLSLLAYLGAVQSVVEYSYVVDDLLHAVRLAHAEDGQEQLEGHEVSASLLTPARVLSWLSRRSIGSPPLRNGGESNDSRRRA